MADTKLRRLKFKLKGSSQDGELVRAEDFAAWINGVLSCLEELGRGLRAEPVLTITGLSIGSAILELDIASNDDGVSATTLRSEFVAGFDYLRSGRLGEAGFAPETRRAFESLLKPMRRQLRNAELQADGTRLALSAADLPLLGQRQLGGSAQLGKIAGFVDAINVHNTPVFYLYPTTGPKRVKCTFDLQHLADVRDSLKRYATVYGLLEYVEGSAFAESIAVESVRPSPPEDELPTLASLWGTAPKLGGDSDSVVVVRRLRDAES